MRVQPTTTTVDIGELAHEFVLSEQDLIVRSLQAFILEQLRLFQTEKRARCARFGVTSLEEMDKLIVEGVVEEKDILNDFQNVDYLTTHIERMEYLLEIL